MGGGISATVNEWVRDHSPENLVSWVENTSYHAELPVYFLLVLGLLVLLALIIVFLLWKKANVGACRWKKSRQHSGSKLTKFVCRRCGVEAFTIDGKPPKECKRNLKVKAL